MSIGALHENYNCTVLLKTEYVYIMLDANIRITVSVYLFGGKTM